MARPERLFVLRWARELGKTPRELLASVTSDDITEQMAFWRIEPTGSLHLEAVIGRLCALIGNIHRKEQADVFMPSDFMPGLARALDGAGGKKAANDEPILLEDPEAQAMLIKQSFMNAVGPGLSHA